MKKKKIKLLSSVFVVIAAVLILSLSAFATTEYTYGKYKYTLTEDDTVCITKYTGTSKTVTIPSEINGKVVTHIGEQVFGEDCPTQKVIIPDSVTTIDNGFDFSNVKTVEIGSGVTEIETDAFYGAWKLEKIIVSDKNAAYKSVDGILYDKEMKTLIRVPYKKKCTELVIPEGVKTIGRNATRYVELESIVIPSTVKKIESFGLSFTGAKSLVIPASVETLEFAAIYHCYGVEKIEIKKGKLKSLDFDDISYCYDLKTVIIPENVEFIDRFHGSTALEEIIVDAKNKNYTTIDGVLYNKEKNKVLIYPASKADETYIIPSSVTVIGDDAFNDIYYKSLKKIYMHVGVKKIEEYAFIYSGGIAISYEGTKAQFDAIKKEDNFYMMVGDITYNNYIYRPVENINVTAKDTSVTLNWDKVPGATGYRVYLKSGSSWKTLKTTTARNYTAEGLSSGTTYTFAIKSYSKASGKTVWAPEQSTVKATTQLGVTTSLKSTTTNNSATLKWTEVNGATGYRVYVKNKETGKWDIAVRTTGKKTTTTIKDLEPGTKYTFAVRAYVNNGSIVWAPKYKSINTVTKPGVTDKVTSTSTENSITLNWSKAPGAIGYRIYILKDGKWKALKTTTGLTYTATGLTAGTKYTFAVKAYTKLSGTAYWASKYAKFVTSTKTEAPSVTKVTAYSGKARVYWSDVNGETGYQVYYSTKENSGFKKFGNFKANTENGYVSGLTSGKTYYFKIRTYIKTDSGYIYSDWSNVKSVKVK